MKTLNKKTRNNKQSEDQKDLNLRIQWLKRLEKLQRDVGFTDAVKFIHDNR